MAAVAHPLVPVFRDTTADGVLVAIPAFNEERFIGSVVHGVQLEGFECLVINDGSSDRTAEIARAAGAMVETQVQNRGKGAAVSRALEVARRLGVEMLVIMDGDWQHDVREIHSLLEPLRADEADVVSGSRFLAADRAGMPAVRGVGLRLMTAISNMASGGGVTDSQTGFHAFSRAAIEAFRFRSTGFAVEIEVPFLARVRGLRYREVPISTRYSDSPKRNVVGQARQVLDGLIRLVARYRPLLFFGLPSTLLLLAGAGIGAFAVDAYQRTREFDVPYALVAILLIILGANGFFAGLLLHVLRGIFLDLEHHMEQIARIAEPAPRRR